MSNSIISLELPYPPTVNTYWGFQGSRRFLTPSARRFKKAVAEKVLLSPTKFTKERLSINVMLYPPDKRKRDIDNVLKPLLDALTQAGAFEDDSQIDVLVVQRKNKISNGLCVVYISIVDPL